MSSHLAIASMKRLRALREHFRRPAVWGSLLAAAAVLALGTCAYAWAVKEVVVVADGRAQVIRTVKTTVEAVLSQAEVTVQSRDIIAPPLDSRIEGGELITVTRAIPLTIIADGEALETTSAQPSVGAVLSEAGVEVGEDDRTEPALDEAPTPGSEIRVVRVVRELETKLWRIPHKTYRREDEHLELGLSRVVEKGRDGVEEVVFCTTYEDGVKIGTDLVERTVTQDPKPETVLVGTSGQISRGGETIRFRKALDVVSTGYYWGPECTGKYADGYTYTGLEAKKGVIAVDPRVIPLMSRVYVDGYGYAIAADIGSAIKGNKIDCCFDTYQEALAWGYRRTKIYLLW